jgi:hypothetical protein
MDNPEKLLTLGKQDTRPRQTKQKNITQYLWTPPYTSMFLFVSGIRPIHTKIKIGTFGCIIDSPGK